MTTLSPTDFVRAAHHTAHHFGFLPLESLSPRRRGDARAAKASAADRKIDALSGTLTGGVSAYFEHALYTEEPTFFFSTQEVPRTGEIALNLQVVGVKKSIAEAILIQTLRSLLIDLGYPNHCVRINSVGDQDSVTRYTRELTNYLKKRMDDMPLSARECMKEHPLSALLCLIDEQHELCAKSPSSLEYLSDASRRHFREIIEHLDMTNTPYEIDANLLGNHRCYSDALFSIDLRDEEFASIPDAPLTIRGGRLDAFTRQVLQIEAPATGAVVILKNKKAPARMPKMAPLGTPSVYMVQLGFGPKIRSLMLLDTLKRAEIPVRQTLASDSLSEQLRAAERAGVPFSLILGQKEYVENSVIVRDMRSSSQQYIPFDTLVPHLRKVLRRV